MEVPEVLASLVLVDLEVPEVREVLAQADPVHPEVPASVDPVHPVVLARLVVDITEF